MANDGGPWRCLSAEVTRPDNASAVPGPTLASTAGHDISHWSLGIHWVLVIGHWDPETPAAGLPVRFFRGYSTPLAANDEENNPPSDLPRSADRRIGNG